MSEGKDDLDDLNLDWQPSRFASGFEASGVRQYGVINLRFGRQPLLLANGHEKKPLGVVDQNWIRK